MSSWRHGNADEDGRYTRGWILGGFMPDGDPRRCDDVEIKWSRHPAGDARAEWHRGEDRHTMAVLIDGRFRIDFDNGVERGSATLVDQGDYVAWGPGVDHSWESEDDSTMMTVRWMGRQ